MGNYMFSGCDKLTVNVNCDSCAGKYRYPSAVVVNKSHNFSTEWAIDIEPTCTEAGSKSHHCSRCEEKSDVTDVEALGHNFSNWQVRTAPTCTETGIEYRTCSACSTEETNTLLALGHKYPEKGNVISQPTTTEPGLQIKVCTICMKDAIYEEIPVLETPSLKQINGQWVYASGDTIITDYTGLVEYYGGYYHVQNGYLDWNYSGLSYYNGNWWYVTNGVIDWS